MNRYQIRATHPESHLYSVELYIPKPLPDQRVSLPAWIPGSYMIRDFARHIINIGAVSADREIALQQLDKQTWMLPGQRPAVRIRYQVYALDLSVRGAHLDNTHGYFNGSCVFLRPCGQEHHPLEVDILEPESDAYAHWRVSTTLDAMEVGEKGFGRYRAENYADLIDHPVEMGRQQRVDFAVVGVPHAFAFTGRMKADLQRIRADMEKICGQHVSLFGELPVSRYLFLTQLLEGGYGGLEHRDSCSLICSRADLPRVGDAGVSEGYRKFLGLCSHEYFHLWNVKRIRPQVFGEADLSAEVYTELLWFFEGVTSYYDDLALLRAGCIDLESYLQLLAQGITRVMRGSGRLKQSLADSSFNAWTKFYRQDENAANAIVSYYGKGALVALGLDMYIRDATGEKASLDTLMRNLWQRFGVTGRGLQEADILAQLESLCQTGGTRFFRDYIHGVEELPLRRWLDTLGIGLRLRAAQDTQDKGGFVGAPASVSSRLAMGAVCQAEGDGLRLVSVADDGAAQQAGLSPGDKIIAIDGIKADMAILDQGFPGYRAGDVLALYGFRNEELMKFELVLRQAKEDTCDLWLLPDRQLTAAQRDRRADWMESLC